MSQRGPGRYRPEDVGVTIRSWLQERHQKNEQFQRDAQAAAVRSVHGLAGLSDEELIASDPSIPSHRHEMEMQRRLKTSIQELTRETSRARWWAFWGAVVIAVLTMVIIALTVVLAMKA
jgi:hypothetical protein